jgi:hypothetical protein
LTVVVSFTGWTPPTRYDDLPWTEVRIEEAATEDGVYAQIDVSTLDPVDTDPSDPEARTFTTELGTAAYLWYRLIWADADGDTSIPTESIQNTDSSAPYATVTELMRILKIRAPTADQLTAGNRVLIASAGEINSEIGLDSETGLAGWQLSLAQEVNLERAVEHWQQQEAAFGIIGLGGVESVAVHTARDSWDRHAHKLAPLKTTWGIA